MYGFLYEGTIGQIRFVPSQILFAPRALRVVPRPIATPGFWQVTMLYSRTCEFTASSVLAQGLVSEAALAEATRWFQQLTPSYARWSGGCVYLGSSREGISAPVLVRPYYPSVHIATILRILGLQPLYPLP